MLKHDLPKRRRIWVAFRYTIAVLSHKYFVLRAGIQLQVPLRRLLVHDWSKFSMQEFWPYAIRFTVGDKSDETEKHFQLAFAHHVKHNDHHWQYWVCEEKALDMPDEVVREMVADWLGACRAYESTWPKSAREWKWWRDVFPTINITENVRNKCAMLIREFLGNQHA